MPAGQGKDAERFAAAVESGTSLGATGDADLARELEIVAMLRSRGAAFAPDTETKARAKQRLMAVLAAEQGGARPGPRPVAPPVSAEMTAPLGRLVEHRGVDPNAETTRLAPVTASRTARIAPAAGAETDTEAGTAADPISLHARRAGRRSRHSLTGRGGATRRSSASGLRGRVVLVGSAAAAALIAIAGGGVLASGDALPGDGLYPVKRVAETAGLALTFDDASRARRHLDIAATRLSEVEQLASRDPQAAPAPEVYTAAMDEFDAATDEGARILLAAGECDTAAGDLHTWASEQSERLAELRPALPAEADADTSLELLERLLGQTEAQGATPECDGDDCASRRASEQSTEASDAADSTENPATPTPEQGRSDDPRETAVPSRTPTTTSERENPGLLPDLGSDGGGEEQEGSGDARSEDEDNPSTSESESGDEGGDDRDRGNLSVPLPLLPPVTLPPLLPGLPGITIG